MQSVNSSNRIHTVNPDWNTRFRNYAFADSATAEMRAVFCDAEGLLARSELVKNSRSTSAGIFRIGEKEYFIKRSNIKSFAVRLRRIGRDSRAVHSWKISAAVEKLGVRVPEVFAAISTYPWGLPGASYLITEKFPLPMTLNQLFNDVLKQYNGICTDLIKEVIRIAAIIHSSGIEHGDLKLSNILAVRQNDNTFELGLFDFDGSVKYSGAVPAKARARELARMASSYFIRCCDLNIAVDFNENLQRWAAIYAELTGFDFSGNKAYISRAVRFVPGDLKYRKFMQ